MFTCFWQLWDWLDPPPLFTTATMENKKLYQMQHENAHFIQQQQHNMPHTKVPPSYHPATGDYRPVRSPVFQNHPQYQSLTSNFAQINLTSHQHPSNSNMQKAISQAGTPSQMMVKQIQNQHMHMTKQQPSPQQMQPKPNTQQGQYPGEQIYQSTKRDGQGLPQQNPTRTHHPAHSHSSSQFQQQYQQIQQARIQAQIRTQNEALIQQQRTFALRQQLNPPIPQSHYHLSPSASSIVSNQRHIPPSSLSLTNQFQPAANNSVDSQNQQHHVHQIVNQKGQNQLIYQQNQQIQQKLMQSKIQQHRLQQQQHQHPQQQQMQQQQHEQNQIIIHQNHPNLVVNQACQTQISGTQSQTHKIATSPSDSSSTPQTPTHQPLEKKKSTGTQIQTLKSPITKRPPSSPVTLNGWLYKQGSDGLKVWRKRWFVLAEYCLYYYKGQEEEKVLGSIPLPSYRVAACSPDDKIYRKFAFKCEHTNMRTYWLAAENSEIMGQWVRALTAATMLQGSSGESDQTSLNHSGENSDSGIHTYQSHQSKLSVQGPLTPASDGSGGGVGVGGGPQPLYANAPPKPRRANDGGYSSPSPENSIERYDSNYDAPVRRHDQAGHPLHFNEPLYDTRPKPHQMNPSLSRMQQLYLETNKANAAAAQQAEIRSPYPSDSQYPNAQSANVNDIVRAPQSFNSEYESRNNWEKDMYMTQQHQQQQQQHPSQNLLSIYPNAERRTPDTYGRSRTAYQNHLAQQQQHQLQQQQLQQQQQQQQLTPLSHHELTTSQGKHISDYEDIYNLTQSQNNATQHVHMRAHPAQAIVPRPHSADFLEYEARAAENSRFQPEIARAPRPKSSLDINRTPDNYYYSEASYAEKMRQSALYLQKQPHASPGGKQEFEDYPKDRRMSEDGHLSSILDTNSITPERYGAMDMQEHQSQSVPRSHRHTNKAYQNELFLRSASARLPRKEEELTGGRDSERKREESMKRLLEWKQRMLQSPLTRKGAPLSVLTPTAKSPVQFKNHSIQRSRSETNANAGYNSYSSDDEASISVRNVRNISTNLTVKADVNDVINRNHLNQINTSTPSYYPETQDHQVQYSFQDSVHPGDGHTEIELHSTNPFLPSIKRTNFDTLENERNLLRNLDVSAGDLLSRTHEELVLLLIQLRRQNSATARAIEQCCTDIHEIQNRIRNTDGAERHEHISKLDTVKSNLIDLEKQYEKSKPLVNLVDNMVKLGSLYRNGQPVLNKDGQTVTLDRYEFNQRMQERKFLQEERKHWDRISPNHLELKAKVQQLYQLDQLLQEESGTLQNLQRDKELIERALGGLRTRLQNGVDPPIALDAVKKEQHALERELYRVHQLLAENSKKLEQTVAGNARLEQELLVLRQKLQESRARGSQSGLNTSAIPNGDGMGYTGGSTAVLESELRRVQNLVGDMQRQRQELSLAVRQLTENSNTLCQQIKPNEYSSHIKKRSNHNGWTETDLDSPNMRKNSSNYSISSDNSHSSSIPHLRNTSYNIETGSSNSNISILNCSSSTQVHEYQPNGRYSDNYRNESDGIESSGMESDDLLEDSNFSNLSQQEKQEIKTVRIVKRESQQRQRDREKSGISSSSQNMDHILEDNSYLQHKYDPFSHTKSLPKNYVDHEIYHQEPPRTPNIPTNYSDYYNNIISQYPVSMTDYNPPLPQPPVTPEPPKYSTVNKPSKQFTNNGNQEVPQSLMHHPPGLRNKTESIQSLTKVVGDLNPVFQSEAARAIMMEMGGDSREEPTEKVPTSSKQRRAVPKEKRRHFTAPHHVNAKSIQSMQAENDMNRSNANWRARDDLDMEVALRPRINAPDVVRSAMGPREKISENTIDKLLMVPNKIVIPERYIPEQTPELSPEEKRRRQEKVESIKKMLSEAPMNSSNENAHLPPSQISADKKQREHLLQLNQILAQQVMQMSKIVAEQAMAALPSKLAEIEKAKKDDDDDRSSPEATPLPIYQQRENYFS